VVVNDSVKVGGLLVKMSVASTLSTSLDTADSRMLDRMLPRMAEEVEEGAAEVGIIGTPVEAALVGAAGGVGGGQ